MKINSIIISLAIILLAGCSWTGKAIYFEPAKQENWHLKTHDNDIFHPPMPAMAEYRCDKISILFRSADAGQQIYTGGPILIPVIPTFGLFNIQSGKYGIKVTFSIEGSPENPGLDTSSVYIILDQDGKKISADEFSGSDLPNNRGSYYYDYNFKSSLLSVNKFVIVLNKTLQNCNIPSIIYELKGYPFFMPVWLPAAAYR
jgi:hypothetical protein